MRNKAEEEFAEIFEEVQWASFSEDVHQHWDLKVDDLRIDVKGIKRVKRAGELNDSTHWLELQNVRGRRGWVYGDADYIAFETREFWVLVNRLELVKFCEEKIEDTYHAYPLYKKKTRPGRQDIISLVPTKDLIQIGTIISKNVLNQDKSSSTETVKTKFRQGDLRDLLICKGKGSPTTLLPQ